MPDYSTNNPYQNLLKQNLACLNVDVIMENYRFWPAITLASLRQQNCRVIHLHWLNHYLKHLFKTKITIFCYIILFLLMLDVVLCKLLRKKIFWTIHNKFSHESKNINLEKKFRKFLYLMSNKVFIHSHSAAKEILKAYNLKNGNKIVVIPHGHFIDSYPNSISKNHAREKLSLTNKDKIILYFGKIRNYKGLNDLIRIFHELKNKNIKLYLVGKPEFKNIGNEINELISNNKNILTQFQHIAPKDIQLFMNCADVCIFPFKEILTSGSVILAMSFAKPIIVPFKANLLDILDDKGTFFYKDINNLTSLIPEIFSSNLANMGVHNKQKISKFTWENMAKSLLIHYQNG